MTTITQCEVHIRMSILSMHNIVELINSVEVAIPTEDELLKILYSTRYALKELIKSNEAFVEAIKTLRQIKKETA